MNTQKLLLILIFILIPTFVFSQINGVDSLQTKTNPARLIITVTNVEKDAGSVVASIFYSDEFFLEKACNSDTIKATSDTVTFTFTLKEGVYAIAIFQDINSNGKLDFNFLHIPKEPFGFGNNYRPFLKPGFEKCSLHVNAPETVTEIMLK